MRHQTSVGIPNLLHLSNSKQQADAAPLRAPLTLCAGERKEQAKQHPYWSNTVKAETRDMTDPDELRAKREEIEVAIYHLNLVLSEVERTRGKAAEQLAEPLTWAVRWRSGRSEVVCKWMQQMFLEGATLAIRLSSRRKPFLGSKGAP